MVGFFSTISKLHRLIGSKPPGAGRAKRNPLTAHGSVPHNIPFVGVTVQITHIPIKKTSSSGLKKILQIGVGRLKSEVEFGKFWNLRHIDAGIVRRLLGIAEWRDFV